MKSISELINTVKVVSPNTEEIVFYGTEEYINRIKDYIPSDVSIKILPTKFFPETREELVYLIPINEAKPLKVVFENNFIREGKKEYEL